MPLPTTSIFYRLSPRLSVPRAERRPREAEEEEEEEEELSSIIPPARRAAAYANVGGEKVFGWKIYCFRAAEYFFFFDHGAPWWSEGRRAALPSEGLVLKWDYWLV